MIAAGDHRIPSTYACGERVWISNLTENEEGAYTGSFEETLADYFGQDQEEDELAEEECASEPDT